MLLSCGVAALLGGREGKCIAGLYITAAFGTYFIRLIWPSWNHPHLQVFIIDTLLLLGLLAVTLNSRKYWPIWITGLHVLTVLAFFQALVAGVFGYRIYFALESVWSVPKLVILLIGVILDREAAYERHSDKRRH
jgi:hypothetical protein